MLVAPAFSSVDPSSDIQNKQTNKLGVFFPLSAFSRFMDLPTQLSTWVIASSWQWEVSAWTFIFAEIFMCPFAMLSSAQKKTPNFKSLHSIPKKSMILMGPFQLSIFCDCMKWKRVLPSLSFSGFTTAHFSFPPPKLSANSTHLLAAPPALACSSPLSTDKILLLFGLFHLPGILYSLPICFKPSSHSSSLKLTFKTSLHGMGCDKWGRVY